MSGNNTKRTGLETGLGISQEGVFPLYQEEMVSREDEIKRGWDQEGGLEIMHRTRYYLFNFCILRLPVQIRGF